MNYNGEHLLPGQIGHLFVVLSFVAALLSSMAYFFATQRRNTPEQSNWLRIGRYGYLVHGLATFAIIGTLFYILTGKMYEYQYAWANIADDLPMQYVFSAFWKEQQGSFLLWSFWHIILGGILIWKSGKWEAPVLATIALAEAIIASMILGLYFGDFRLGASPFDLLRDVMDAPIFAQADYLSKIKGQGLNPLLQNYWMTIHPPTLFLGFASTIVPFAFAIAGLWTREHREWLRPALNWSLFSGAILGTGILMGGAWAYEALSFGGYWAWDPVENTSLVPWLVLVAGIHTNLIARATGYSIRSTYGFYLLSFIMVLYSTYLTRSGILGDTSAHAFTEMGLGFQLILFICGFSLLSLFLLISRSKGIPSIPQEEKFQSREFWMFMGSLVLFFSGLLMTGATSLPVWNKIMVASGLDQVHLGGDNWFSNTVNALFAGKLALKEPIEHHNRYQMWIAVFMGLLSAVGQWLRYGESNWSVWYKKFTTHIGIALVAAAILSFLNARWINIHNWQLATLLFTAMFTVASNADYMITMVRGNLKLGASAASHIGFGLLILGILSTGLGKSWISTNAFAMDGLIEGMGDDDLNKNVLLMKEAPMPIGSGQYVATYLRDSLERQTRSFAVQFKKQDATGNATGEEFTLTPNVMYDRRFEKVVASNPSTQHYWNYDIFTHVSSLPKAELDAEFAKQQEDSLRFDKYEALIGDTIFTKEHYVVVEGLTKQPKHPEYRAEKGDLAFGLKLRAYNVDNPQAYIAEPMMYLRPGQGGYSLAANLGQLQMRIRLTESSMEKIFKVQDELKFTTFQVSNAGESFDYQGYKFVFKGVDKNINHPNYTKEEGDIAVAAAFDITAPNGQQAKAGPVFLIRGTQPFNLKDEVPVMGLHLQFEKVDPKSGLLTIGVAQASTAQRMIPIEIAENAARSDYIVLEAIIFPGIKLVWLGSIMMIIGLALGFWRRMSEKRIGA